MINFNLSLLVATTTYGLRFANAVLINFTRTFVICTIFAFTFYIITDHIKYIVIIIIKTTYNFGYIWFKVKPLTFAGTAISLILGLARFKFSMISAYSSLDVTCKRGLLFLSFSIVENFLLL